MCVWVGRMCYAVAMISNTVYAMNAMYTYDGALFRLVAGGLLVQFLWFLFRKELKNITVGFFLTVVSCMYLLATMSRSLLLRCHPIQVLFEVLLFHNNLRWETSILNFVLLNFQQ